MSVLQPLDPRIDAYLSEGPTEFPLEQRLAVALATEELGQRRPRFGWSVRLPWLFVAGDTDPTVRRRAFLLLAIVGLLASIALAAVVGAWLESRKPVVEVDGPSEADLFVLRSYERFAELPAFRLVVTEPESLDTVYFYDGIGTMREEYGGDPTLFAANFIAESEPGRGAPAWRVSSEIYGHPLGRLAERVWPGLDCATGWELVSVTEVLGRPAQHVRCSQDELWIDTETGLPLRSSLGGGGIRTAIEFEIGPQDADLFVLDGDVRWAEDEGCARDGLCASFSPPTPQPPSGAVATPPPALVQAGAPGDVTRFVAEVHERYRYPEPVDIVIDRDRSGQVGSDDWWRWRRDGLGNYRSERDNDPTDSTPGVTFLTAAWRTYETDPNPQDGRPWRDRGPGVSVGDEPFVPTLGLPRTCGLGWTYLGDDLVLARPAAHLTCGFQEFWIDREWLLVTRAHNHDPMLGDDPNAGLTEVTSVTFEPQPAELFVPPPPDSVWSGYAY